jgi:phage gp29-like protein
MAMEIYSSKSNQWREYYNPLRGLSIPRIVSLIEAGERGQYADLQWMYYHMERSDPMVFSIMQRRRAALLNCDWDVRRVAPGERSGGRAVGRSGGRDGQSGGRTVGRLDGGEGERSGGQAVGRSDRRTARPFDRGLAAEQAVCLREVYEGIDNFKDAVGFLFTGIFRGYAHVEKHYGAQGEIERLEPVEQWFWVRDGMFGDWEYNENAVSGRRHGVPIKRENFVVIESLPLNQMLAPLYLRRVLGQRNWDSYLDVFGIPSLFLVGPPQTSPAMELEYQKIADAITSQGKGYLPNGTDIKYVTGGGGKPPYRDELDYIDRQITLVGTGGLLTMLSESGAGTLAGNAHQEAFLQIARGDAVTVSSALQRELDQPVLNAAFPGKPALAYFEFQPNNADQTSRVVQDAVQLAAAGMAMDPAELSEKSGYRVAPAVSA